MKYTKVKYIVLFCLSFFIFLKGSALTPHAPIEKLTSEVLDSARVYASTYEKIIDEYTSNVYIKGTLHVKKKNWLIRYIPIMFDLDKDVRKYILESYSDLHFTSPNIYDQRVRACVGTIPRFKGVNEETLQYFNINIYSSSLLFNKLLSPLSMESYKYYSFKLDSVWHSNQGKQYKIKFIPKTKSYQLVKGYLVLTDKKWSVREMFISGKSEYVQFNNLIEMGDVGTKSEYLPISYDAAISFRFLGNRVDGGYSTRISYNDIKLNRSKKRKPQSKYDLSDSFSLSCDTSAMFRDSLFFERLRPIGLNNEERELYRKHSILEAKEEKRQQEKKNQPMELWGALGDFLINDYSVNLSSIGSIKCSPLINPLLLEYSHSNGLSYRQDFKYHRLFKGDKLLSVLPSIGYNFTRKEFYWNVKSDFEYYPEKKASIHLDVGNGNRIFSSDILDDLKSIPDSVFDFKQINLNYFHDFYVELNHSFEITNGLTLYTGVSVHKRIETKPSKFMVVDPTKPISSEFLDRFGGSYTSFAPRLRLSWTPYQYYYMRGKRKMNLYSSYPTFSVDWERGIKGVFKSSGKYERLEFDMQHRIPLGLMSNLYYRFGMGAFTNQKQLFFVDFANFSKSNLPTGWNDEIGGRFQLLDREFYNSSRKYIRAHVTYETPFLIIPKVFKKISNVLNERLYFSALCVPHLTPYLEFGYGVGTHIFDTGVFVGSRNGELTDFGFKFTFELFNR